MSTHITKSIFLAWLLAEKPIIIDLLVSPWARKRQKHPTSLSSARNTSSKRHLDDTVPWHTLGICPSLWTVNESATDEISHYEKPVMAPLHCSSQYQLHLILHRWWWKCCSWSPAGKRGEVVVWAELINGTLTHCILIKIHHCLKHLKWKNSLDTKLSYQQLQDELWRRSKALIPPIAAGGSGNSTHGEVFLVTSAHRHLSGPSGPV